MEVNDELVDKLAKLSRLRFDRDEKEEIKKDLQNMIALIDKMNTVNTEGVEPLLHMTDNINILRADKVEGSVTNEEALLNAAQKQPPFFTVPKVIIKPADHAD